MEKQIIKIRQLARGISELFSAIDKGLGRIESDTLLLKKFRMICFTANESLDNSVAKLNGYALVPASSQAIVADPDLLKNLREIKHTAGTNMQLITDYIEEYINSRETSFSLEALNKFKFLLEQEFHLLQKEINALKMQIILQERKSQIHEILKKTVKV